VGRPKKAEPATDPHGRVTVINLKGRPEDREWLDQLSRRTMIPASRIVRAALREWAERNKHPKPPWSEDGA
jgi:hypothetical protein